MLDNKNNFILSTAQKLVRWRWLLMLGSFVTVTALTFGAQFIGFGTDYEIWFAKDNPELHDFRILQNTYNKSDNVIFLLAPKDGNVFTRETLSEVEWLTKQAWQIPYSIRVNSITNYQHTEAKGDELSVKYLVENAASLSGKELEKIKRIAMHEPLLLNNLISANGGVTAVNVTINLPKNDPQGSPKVTAFARDLIAQLNKRAPSIETHLTGLVVANNAFVEATQKDMESLTLIMFLIIVVGLVIALRTLSVIVSVLVLIVFSILATLGFGGWIGVKLTPVSMGATTVVMTVMVAHAVHLLVSLVQGMRAGMSKRDALIESLRINLQPLFLATITTVIGFLSMLFADIPPFQDLGNMAAMGVAVTFLLSIAFLPGLVMILPIRVKAVENYSNRHMLGVADFVHRWQKPILWSMAGVVALSVLMLSKNEITENTWEYFDKSVPFRVDTDYASEHLIGPYFMEYSLDTKVPNGIADPRFLGKVIDFQKWLQEQPEVVHVDAITDIVKRLNRNMHGDDETWYRLPESRELTAQYLLLYELSLPYGLDLTNQINLDKSATRVFVSLHNQSSKNMIAFNDRVESWLAAHAQGISVVSGSPMYMFAHIGQRAAKSMVGGIMFALALVSFVLMISFRSIKIGLLSLLPNLAPPIIAFGIWGVFVGQISAALALGLGMTIGIIIDDTVHFISKYIRARREKNLGSEEAIRYAFSNVGVALMVTSLVLVAGFAVLATSSFKQNSDLGLITLLTIIVALIFDFLLLPILLKFADKKLKPASGDNG